KLPGDWGKGAAKSSSAAAGGPAVAQQQPSNAEVQAPANAPIEMQQAATSPTIPSGASAEVGVTQRSIPVETTGSARPAASAVSAPAGGRVAASPLARKIAQDMGVDLHGVQGSGPRGRIIERDVKAAAQRGPVTAPMAIPSGAPVADQIVPLNKL